MKATLTVREAADLIGMTASGVRQACRGGLIKARKKELMFGGFAYMIPRREAIRYRNLKQARSES